MILSYCWLFWTFLSFGAASCLRFHLLFGSYNGWCGSMDEWVNGWVDGEKSLVALKRTYAIVQHGRSSEIVLQYKLKPLKAVDCCAVHI
jgi:hypothetical protein